MLRLVLLLSLQLSIGYTVNYGLTSKVVDDETKDSLADPTKTPEELFASYWSVYNDIEPLGHRSSLSPDQLAAERRATMANYKKSLAMVRENNKLYALGEVSYKMAMNSFSVMSDENRQLYMGWGRNSVNYTDVSPHASVDSSYVSLSSNAAEEAAAGSCPDEMYMTDDGCAFRQGVGSNRRLTTKSQVDYKSYFPSVKQQGGCGSCWTYPAAGLLEFDLRKATGTTTALSEQELLDCTYEGQGWNGCRGGWYYLAWKFVQDKGSHLASQAQYAYRGTDSTCNYRHYRSALAGKIQLTSWHKVSPSSVLTEMQSRPLAVAFFASSGYSAVSTGIFNGYCSGASNHAITLTGYGPGYWDTRNSWGQNWGNRGYSKFRRSGTHSICNILDTVYAIRTKKSDGTDPDPVDPTDGGNCQDLDGNCSAWHQGGYCSSASYAEWMSNNCPKSCGKCESGGGGNCADVHSGCSGYHQSNYCTSGDYIEWMAINCKKTCGKCKEKEEEEEEEENNTCSDVGEYASSCPGWKTDGYCKAGNEYAEWMYTNCKKTCGKCGGDTDVDPTEEGGDGDGAQKLEFSSVAQSSTHKKNGADKAVDNDYNTMSQTSCTNKAKKSSASFTFNVKATAGKQVKVTKVEITGKHFSGKVKGKKAKLLDKLNGATVKVGPSSCGTVTVDKKKFTKADQTYTISCGNGLIGTTVKIEQASKSYKGRNCLDIAEVKVYGTVSGDETVDPTDDKTVTDGDDIDERNRKCKAKTGCNCGLVMCKGTCTHAHFCH